MNFLSIFRIIALGLSFLFAIIVMGLSGHLTSLILEFEGAALVFGVLALAASILTILTLPVMLILDFVRTGAFTSMVLVELIWLSILWVLWLSTGADAANSTSISFPDGCIGFIYEELNIGCHESAAITAFSFLTFILLLAYTITLLTYAIIASNKGHPIWKSTVRQGNSPGTTAHNIGESNGSVYGSKEPIQQYSAQTPVLAQGLNGHQNYPPQPMQGGHTHSPYPQV